MSMENYNKNLTSLITKHVIRELRRTLLVVGRGDFYKRCGSTNLPTDREVLALPKQQARWWIERTAEQILKCALDAVVSGSKKPLGILAGKAIAKRMDYHDQMCRLPPVIKKRRYVAKPRPQAHVPLTIRRHMKAEEMLKDWKRKQKLAATKVKFYQRKCSYYEKRNNRETSDEV